jgi:poly(3-hydroxyalkanoate) synthetase
MGNFNGDEDITLVGHSHGGNVAIQAIPILRKALDDAGYSDIKINLVTVSTPADNTTGSVENPKTYASLIDSHMHLYNTNDLIQTTGANLMGGNGLIGPLATFERAYENDSTENIEIDVSEHLGTGPGAHSFDVSGDGIIKENIKNGKIKSKE